MVAGACTSSIDAPSIEPTDARASSLFARRIRVVLVVAGALLVSTAAVAPGLSPAPVSAAATTTSTIYGPVVALASFPVQGPCNFIDTYGAPRSGSRLHEGVDLIAKSGQLVYAVADGTLTKKYTDTPGSLSGNGWRLTAADNTYYFYAHFSAFATGLAVGNRVVAGQVIGYVGMTGNAGTPHLHFEIHPGGGAPINPTPSVRAVDGCAVTTPPPVATNPANPTTPTSAGSPVTTAAPAPTSPPVPVEASFTKWQFVEPVVVFNGTASTTTKKIKIAGVPGIAANTTGVLVRVSATVGSSGSVVVHPCAGAAPIATTLFAESGPMAIGATIVGVVNGEICITSNSAGSAKVTVTGQLAASGVGVAPIVTTRALDSRITGKLVADRTVTLSPAAIGGVPGAKAVTVAFTILSPSAAGTLAVGPCGGTPLKAPFNKAALWAFSAVLAVSDAGLCVTSTTATNVVVDVDAVWLGDVPAVLPVKTERVFDSRSLGAPVNWTPVPVQIAAPEGGPVGVTTAAINVTILGGPAGGSVFVWPCEKPMPTSAVGAVAPNKRGTFSVVASVSDGTLCVAANQPVHVLLDVNGIN